jgi:DNA-binding NtrC family response regulator
MSAVNEILWIGPTNDAEFVSAVLNEQGLGLNTFADADAALGSPRARAAAVAIVSADWDGAPEAIRKLRSADSEIVVLAATNQGVPAHLGSVIAGGTADILDLKASHSEIVGRQIDDALKRHRWAVRERELLLRLRSVNDELLRSLVNLEEHNVALARLLQPEEVASASCDPEATFRVLLIDDEPSIREVFALALEGRGLELFLAPTAEDGLRIFGEHTFQIVIADKNLPGLSGLEVARRVKEINSETDVIMITAYASKESAIDALNCGICAFIEKPFESIDHVVAQIERVAAGHRERLRKRYLLSVIKSRNRTFLEQYRSVRAEIEAWLKSRGPVSVTGSSPE